MRLFHRSRAEDQVPHAPDVAGIHEVVNPGDIQSQLASIEEKLVYYRESLGEAFQDMQQGVITQAEYSIKGQYIEQTISQLEGEKARLISQQGILGGIATSATLQ